MSFTDLKILIYRTLGEKMENKTCRDCKSFPGMGYYCPIIGRFCHPNNEKPCEFFERPMGRVATNGDRIRQMSNEELAELFALGFFCEGCPLKDVECVWNCVAERTYAHCYDKFNAYLNAPADSEVKNAQN